MSFSRNRDSKKGELKQFILLIFLSTTIVLGVYLVSKSQDVRKQAAELTATNKISESGILTAPQAIPNPEYKPNVKDSFRQKMLVLVNRERSSRGVPPLKNNPNLVVASNNYAEYMGINNFFGHRGLDGNYRLGQRLDAAGYKNWVFGGENIAAGFNLPEGAMQGFMNSEGHRNNILNPEFREIGIGYFYDTNDKHDVVINPPTGTVIGGPYFHYWVQDLGKRNDGYPVIINNEDAVTSSRNVKLYIYGLNWAKDMRIANDANFTGAWWRSYNPDYDWTLTAGTGNKNVYIQLRNANNELYTSSDSIYLSPLSSPTPSTSKL